MIRLLLLSCGTNACTHIAKILKQNFKNDFYIIGCDINKSWLVPSIDFIDDFIQCPLSKDESYYDFIISLCKEKKTDWILPSFDSDQFLFSSDNDDLKKIEVKSLGISSTLEFYHNKQKTNEFLASIGIPVPQFFSFAEIIDDNEYFIKPANGVGSIGARKVSGKDVKLLLDFDKYIIQEVLYEPEYTLECFFYNQKIYSVCRERIASKSGVCTKTRIFQDEKLVKYAQKLAENADVPFIFNMQFMKNQNGDYVCTDLNLRSAGGMSLSYTAGWDEVSALAKIMLNKSEREILETVEKNISELYVVRRYEDVITKIVRNRIAFDLDGTLLDSRKRHEIVMADLLKKHDIDLDTSDLVDFKSDGKNNLAWLIHKEIDENLAKEINAEWIALIEAPEYLKTDFLYPNVIGILSQLSKENDLFLITARSKKENAILQIKNLGIAQYFTDISVVDSCKETAVLKSVELQKYKVDCFIGDTESDYKAAEIAGCNFKAVSYGFRTKQFWQKMETSSINDILESIN